MKKFGFLLLLLVVAVMLGGTALAQDTDTYFVTYFSGNIPAAPDATLRIVNDGSNTGGPLYATIFVSDDSEELTQCCSCEITSDGLLSENVRLNLTANSLTGKIPTRGVIQVIAGSTAFVPVKGMPQPPYITPSAGLHGWMTHIQATKVTLSAGMMVVPTLTAPYLVTETELADAVPNSVELDYMQTLCWYDVQLSGSLCTCQPEDYDY